MHDEELTATMLEPLGDEPIDNQADVNNDAVGLTPEVETTGTTTTGTVGTQAKVPYTLEEMKALDPEQVDTSRIPPEHKPFYDSMRAGFDKKFKSVAELKRDVEAEKQRIELLNAQAEQARMAQANPEYQLYSQYKQNPAGTTAWLEGEMDKLAAVDPYDPNIRKLQSMLNRFTAQLQTDTLTERQMGDIQSKAFEKVLTDMPDFHSKNAELSEFVVSEGLDPRVLQLITTPQLLDRALKLQGVRDIDGADAFKQIVRFVNKAHQMATASKTLANKEIKKAPPPLAEPGGSSGDRPAEKDPNKMSQAEYKKWRTSKK